MMSPSAAELANQMPVRSVELLRPLSWLQRGWQDLVRCPGPGLAHGAAAALFGAVMWFSASQQFWWLSGAFSGFLLVAPIVATSLYDVSRKLEGGEPPPSLPAVLAVWRSQDGRLVRFGLLLALAGTGWVLTSASLITGFATEPVRHPADFLRHVVLAEGAGLFEAWLVLGGVLASPVFASSVVALPMLLHRRVQVMTAVLVSWRVVMHNPMPMALWAALLLILSVVGMAFAMIGLIPIVPWLAHASWHAYRDLVGEDESKAPA
jgi:uncharacterized membrane protein